MFADGAQERGRTESASGVVVGIFCEATEIVTMEDKMLIEEVLSNTGWTYTAVNQTLLVLNYLQICGLT